MTTHDPDAIERIAEAICAAEYEDVDPVYAWRVQDVPGRARYRRQAIAALDAIDAPPAWAVATLERMAPVEAALEPWEPHEVVLVPVYSGEPGARDVIARWEAIIRLYRGWMATGHGTTIEAAIRDALADLGALEAGR